MTRPRAVAFVASTLAYGGAERVLVEQVRALAPWGVPTDVWVTRRSPMHLAPELSAAGPHVREVALVPSTLRLAARLWRRRTDLVVAYHAPRAYRALLRLRRVPFAPRPVVVETVHERYRWALARFRDTRPRAIDACLLTHDLRATVGPWAGLPSSRLFVARPWFPSSLVDLDERAREAGRALRRRLGVGPASVVVGYFGRHGDNKGLLALVEVVRSLVADGLDVHLVLAGRACPELGDFDARLDAALRAAGADARGAGRFHRLGALDDPAAMYAALDVAVLLSRTEGLLPLFLVEAMSAGVAAVTTDVGGIAECLRDGVDAEVVRKRPDDEEDATPDVLDDARARLARLVLDPSRRAALAAAGCARVRALVGGNDFAADTRAALTAALALGPRRAREGAVRADGAGA